MVSVGVGVHVCVYDDDEVYTTDMYIYIVVIIYMTYVCTFQNYILIMWHDGHYIFFSL